MIEASNRRVPRAAVHRAAGAGAWAAAARRQLGESRWHFQHGPIDLVIDVDADHTTRDRAMVDCWEAFQSVLPTLVAELPVLRRPASEHHPLLGAVAGRMHRACACFADHRFITPMAAVAGSVADELIGVFKRPGVRRAAINNGGDIAFHLAPGSRYRIGICARIEPLSDRAATGGPIDSVLTVTHPIPVRGVATSGWRGRSLSLGIADSVTVLATDAATADAAATLIANAVNIGYEGIVRAPANAVKDDSDLEDRLVTVNVPPLPVRLKSAALSHGRAEAERWRDGGFIHAAALFLQGEGEVVLPLVATARA